MFPEYPTLFYTEGLLFRIPRLFLIGSNLWYPIYFSPHNGGHSCTCSKLPRSSFELRQHYSYNGFNHTDFSRKRQKGAFFKIPSQLQTKLHVNDKIRDLRQTNMSPEHNFWSCKQHESTLKNCYAAQFSKNHNFNPGFNLLQFRPSVASVVSVAFFNLSLMF